MTALQLETLLYWLSMALYKLFSVFITTDMSYDQRLMISQWHKSIGQCSEQNKYPAGGERGLRKPILN